MPVWATVFQLLCSALFVNKKQSEAGHKISTVGFKPRTLSCQSNTHSTRVLAIFVIPVLVDGIQTKARKVFLKIFSVVDFSSSQYTSSTSSSSSSKSITSSVV